MNKEHLVYGAPSDLNKTALLQAGYLAIVRDLQEVAKRAPRVTQEDVLDVASMSIEDLRRRALVARDWHKLFASCLDGIPEIFAIGGAGIDGCRGPREIRAVVDTLVKHCPITWQHGWRGAAKVQPSNSADNAVTGQIEKGAA